MTKAFAIINSGNDVSKVVALPTIQAAKKLAQGSGNGNHVIASEEDLEKLTGPKLKQIFNKIASKPVDRFADTKSAIRRTWAALQLLEVEAVEEELPAPAPAPAPASAPKKGAKGEKAPKQPKAPKKTGPSEEEAANAALQAAAARSANHSKKKASKQVTHIAFGDAAEAPKGIVAEFGVGAGTNREKLLKKLHKNLNKFVSISDLMVAVYGEARKDYKGQLMMVMKGLKMIIESRELPYVIQKHRKDKENAFGLFGATE